ncbi:hypothetical protein [Polaromonas sp.]|uniref:hypothetical protein n=1 Tax=Polaromonas sp. TaxID=1869339 RepID=UPI003C908944
MPEKIKCHQVRYRQGFVEITNVHAGCVNLEVWNIHPDTDIAEASLESSNIPDAAVISNTEIELNVPQARRLIQLLQIAIDQVEK